MSIKASIVKKSAFIIELLLMLSSNLTFIILWWILFKKFQTIGSWTLTDMLVLNAVGMGAYGLSQILFGGLKNLSKLILTANLDSFLTTPKNILFHIAGSKSFSKGFGNLMTTISLIILGDLYTKIPLILLSMITGCLVFVSGSIIAQSLAFWLGKIDSVAKKYSDSLYLFALYPTNIYSGVLQIVMFSLIPAGIIGYIPVELIKKFTFEMLFALLASSTALFSLACFIFHQGLKKYESGSTFTHKS
ncbi:MAG: hypothetical protein FJZ59_03575 [Chlamydiae bacterium]|jgi:ABC-2 type transport system permease protein|nr:hypothetical protein [Chlamydiota bacterium]